MARSSAASTPAGPGARAALIAAGLSPVCAVLLPGSQVPIEFCHPLSLVLQCSLYGGGCLLAHDVARRAGRGWPSILLLGVAFGLILEGLARGSLTSGDWVELGPLAFVGRLGTWNLLWAQVVLLHHAMLAVAVPILLAELIVPAAKGTVWLDAAGLSLAAFALLGTTVASMVYLHPPEAPRAALVIGLLAALLSWRAVRWRPRPPSPARRLPPWLTGVQAFAFEFTVIGLMVVVPADAPGLDLRVLWAILAGWALIAWFGWRLARRVAAGWTDAHRFAYAAGTLSCLALLAFGQELDPARVADPSGMGLVGLATLLGTAWLGRAIRRRSRGDAAQ